MAVSERTHPASKGGLPTCLECGSRWRQEHTRFGPRVLGWRRFIRCAIQAGAWLAWQCIGRVYGLWSESTMERRSITRSRLLHAPDFREPAAARCLALRDEAETTLVRSHLESNQFQQATRPTTSAGIGNGTPSSAESFWGAQHAFVNLDRSACIAWSSRRTKSVSRKMRAAPACFGGTIL